MNNQNKLSIILIIGAFLFLSYPVVDSISIDKPSMDKSSKLHYKEPEMNSCNLCKDVVDMISYEYRVANKTITDIIQVVRDLCKIIGGPVVDKECNAILDSIDNILKWIGSGDNSTLICDKLHYCNTTTPYIAQNTHIFKKVKKVAT